MQRVPSHPRSRPSQTTLARRNSHLGSRSASAAPVDEQPEKEERFRVQSYWAHALILFNVYGVPLSFGPYLEYYYNTMFPTSSIYELSLVLALQIFCIYAMTGPAICFYQQKRWRTLMICATVFASTLHIPLGYMKQTWALFVLKGICIGSALGILRGMSLLCLASHYKNNIPLASMQSGAAAMAGALVYTVVAWILLRTNQYRTLNWVNFALSIVPAPYYLSHIKKSKRYDFTVELTHRPEPDVKVPGKIYFLTGYLLLVSGLFVYPIFAILIMTLPPSSQFPDEATKWFLTTFGGGFFTSAYFANHYAPAFSRTRIGPVNIFIACSLYAALCLIPAALHPYLWVLFSCSFAYGLFLGPILTLHVKVLTVFDSSQLSYYPSMVTHISIMSFLSGLAAFAGVLSAGFLVHYMGEFKLPLLVYGAVMGASGVLMAVGRWQRCRAWVRGQHLEGDKIDGELSQIFHIII